MLRHNFPEFIKGRKPDNGAMLYGKLVQTTVKEQGLPAVTSYKWEDVKDVDTMLGNPGVPVWLPGEDSEKEPDPKCTCGAGPHLSYELSKNPTGESAPSGESGPVSFGAV